MNAAYGHQQIGNGKMQVFTTFLKKFCRFLQSCPSVIIQEIQGFFLEKFKKFKKTSFHHA